MPMSRADQSLSEILRYHLNIYNNHDLRFSDDWSLQQGKGVALNEEYYCQGVFYYLKCFID